MPDITMCADVECQLREKCYRYMAEPDSMWQTYVAGSPRKTPNGAETILGEDACDIFYVMKDKPAHKTLVEIDEFNLKFATEQNNGVTKS